MHKRDYDREIMEIGAALTDSQRDQFMDIFEREAKNPVKLYGWNAWLGFLGADRFVVGDIGLGFLKLITLGGLGVWQIVDCFLIGNRTRDRNILVARDIYDHVRGPTV